MGNIAAALSDSCPPALKRGRTPGRMAYLQGSARSLEMKRYLVVLACISSFNAIGQTQLLGHSVIDVCTLSQVHKDDKGNYAPENRDQRMLLYMRCEGTMQLFPGRPLQGKEQCCLHVSAKDAHDYSICPDNATGSHWKNGVKGELKNCGNQPTPNSGSGAPPATPYYTYLVVHCNDPGLGNVTSEVQIITRSSVSCQDAHNKALAEANSTNKCVHPNPGVQYPGREETDRNFLQSGTCPP
jgi:hypothetical protein